MMDFDTSKLCNRCGERTIIVDAVRLGRELGSIGLLIWAKAAIERKAAFGECFKQGS